MSTCSESSGDKECPLCMETLELDDVNFFPCKCEYQICRFCWHRIRTDENGLCPACRQPYPEDPPMTSDDVQKAKDEKRLKKQAEKTKISDARQYLSNYRVLQKNLVYVVGISPRVADSELLKKNEYFGRYGKIQKVVTSVTANQPPNHPPSHTAYVTYKKCDDALRAIQGVSNSMLDGRIVKASLGTTKYCSSFLNSRKCFKPECMYLHEIAEPEISFTKDDMHAGKHTDYEKRLIEAMNSRPPPPQTTIASHLDKILAPAVSSQTNNLPTETRQTGSDVDRTEDSGSATQLSGDEHINGLLGEDDAQSTDTSNVGVTSEAQEANVAQFQSVDDPAPSNLANEAISSKRSNATARERQWSERDEISVAPSNTPPTDPEANENDFEEDINRSDIADQLARLCVNEDRLDRLSFTENEYLHTGIPAPAKHQEAPAPLMQWEALLGITTQTPTSPSVVEPSSLFSSFKLDSFNSPSMFPTQSSATNSFRREPSPPPGLGRFNSDDDLGFDPFTESSKGLSVLLQEEQEQIPPNRNGSSGMDVLKQLLGVGQLAEQRQAIQQHQHSQPQQPHHHPLQQQQQQNDQHHTFLHQLHAQQRQQQQQQQQQHQQQQQQQQYATDLNRDMMFNRMLAQRQYDTASTGYSHPFGNVHHHQQQHQPPQQPQQPQQPSQSSSLLQDLFNRQQQQQQQQAQQQAQQQQQQQNQMYGGMNSYNVYNDMMFNRMPFGMAPPPGLGVPSANRTNTLPPHLQSSSLHQHQQPQSLHQQSQQNMGLFSGMRHSLNQEHQQPQQSAQDAFKALLPNVNVRFMDDSSMTRWSHENSLRSQAIVPPPPGFSSVLNR